jgi:hypothetical protein
MSEVSWCPPATGRIETPDAINRQVATPRPGTMRHDRSPLAQIAPLSYSENWLQYRFSKVAEADLDALLLEFHRQGGEYLMVSPTIFRNPTLNP